MDLFVAMEKEYTGTLRLGLSTPSMDLETAGMTGGEEGGEGEVVEVESESENGNEDDDSDKRESAGNGSETTSSTSTSTSTSTDSLVRAIPYPWEHVSDADLERAAKSLTQPKMLQSPPMFSAVSVKGERLYLAARRGEVVERAAREISVTRFDVRRRASRLEKQEGEKQEGGGGAKENEKTSLCPDVDFRVACSKGTYVRVLAADLGTAAGTAAHLVALRRTRIGEASVEDAWPLLELVAAVRGGEEEEGKV